MIFDVLPVGPFQMNAYLVGCRETREAAIIDAGDQVNDLLAMAQRHDVKVVKILQTHGHVDHVGAIQGLKASTGAKVYLHRAELPVYESSPTHALMYGITGVTVPDPDEFMLENQIINIGEMKARVIETPGHTPGGVVFFLEQEGALFVGDTLFAGSVGRTDLPGGDYSTLLNSLAKLMKLPPETRVFSGHGPQTTIAEERASNPFIQELFK